MSLARRSAAFVVALLLVAFAPGLAPYEAAAQVFAGGAAASSGAGASGAAVFGSGPAALAALPPAAALAPALSSILPAGSALAVPVGAAAGAFASPTLAPAAAPARTALPASAIAGAAAAGPAAAPAAPTLAAASPAAAASPVSAAGVGTASAASVAVAPASAPTPALPQLSAAARELGQAQAGAEAGLLEQLFTGARRALGLDAAAPAVTTFSAPAAEPAVAAASGLERATAPVPLSVVGTGLQPGEPLLSAAFTPRALESRAVDSALPLDPRKSARSLQRAAAANPEASLELPTGFGRLRALAASAPARLGRLIGWDAPSPPAPGPDEPINGKTLAGLILQSVPSMAAYMLVTLAFVAVAVPVVGWPGYGLLMSLSPMAGIAASNVMGQVVRKMSARNAMALNTLLRVASLSALPLFHLFGVVNFGTLLVGALAEGWLLSSIMTTQSSFLRVLFPAKQLGNINGAIMLMFPAVQTVLGLFLGVGRLADVVSPYLIFAGAAAINLALVPLIWKTIPNIKLMQDAPAADAAPAQPLRSRAAAFARRYWKEAALLAAAVAYFAGAAWLKPAFASSLPIAAALVYWITRTDAFRALRSGASREVAEGEKAARTDAERAVYRRRQFKTVALLALSTLMYYPLYLVAAPHIAELLAGSAHKIELTSQFLGALFFGGMISISGRTKLPDVKIPLPGGRSYTVGAHRIIQAAVVAMAGLWMFTKMFPGSVPIALAGAAAAAGLIALAGRVTDRGWIKMVGVGFAAVWLPFVVWTWPALIPFLTVKMAMSLALLAAGLVSGPNGVSLYTYLYRSTQARESSRVGGLQGAFFNAAISVGYALLTIASRFLNPAYPALLAALGVVNLLVGAAFWRAPKSLPGLAPTILERRAPQTDKARP
ncbi:MAG: hypothetical protein HKL90_07870 [Elusimicrobia bacterium]|nr:hypothetical protein [Elusimicrobiota bacterium]